MKVFVVIYEEEGEYIGHGLCETNTSVISVHATKESAEAEVKKLSKDGGSYYVSEQEVNE